MLSATTVFAQDDDHKPSFNDGLLAFNTGDTGKAAQIFLDLANDGDEEAQYYIATMMEAGEGTSRDPYGAVGWFLKSAEAGYLPAISYMGYATYTGRGVLKNERDAFKWFAKAARMGDAVAQNNLGVMLRDGIGYSKQDPQLAAQWFLQSATQNNARAQYNLATAYRFGQGVKMNFNEALRWYNMAASQGDKYAESALGSMYAGGQGVRADMNEAIKWYLRAAEKGHVPSEIALARIYETSSDPAIKSPEGAVAWYRRAAERNTQAQYRLGFLYETGDGVTQSLEEASYWYSKAVADGYVPAIGALCRLAGHTNSAGSNDSAVKELFESGANAGDPYCQLQLGRAHEKGMMGLEKNPVQAYQWLALAAQGLPDGDNKAAAVVSRIEIANTLSEAQLSEARQKVNAWKPTALASANTAEQPQVR